MTRQGARYLAALVAGASLGLGVPDLHSQEADMGETTGPTLEQLTELHSVVESLWNDYVPESIKAEYELISRDQWLALFGRLARAGQQQDLSDFAALAPETRAAIEAIRAQPDFAEYADWLRERLADMEAAGEAVKLPPAPPSPPPSLPPREDGGPSVRPKAPGAGIPLYDLWLGRVAKRPRPVRADKYLPVLREAFADEGVPEALVWVAEVESAFNPNAKSPVGARGLFQLMPATAKSLGLSLRPFDQRTHPEPSARAAAVYLKKLYKRFDDWSLALAAYNAGEGRVERLLKERGAKDFAGIASHLPAETKLYVPKVLATVRLREGVAPEDLPPPRR